MLPGTGQADNQPEVEEEQGGAGKSQLPHPPVSTPQRQIGNGKTPREGRPLLNQKVLHHSQCQRPRGQLLTLRYALRPVVRPGALQIPGDNVHGQLDNPEDSLQPQEVLVLPQEHQSSLHLADGGTGGGCQPALTQQLADPFPGYADSDVGVEMSCLVGSLCLILFILMISCH